MPNSLANSFTHLHHSVSNSFTLSNIDTYGVPIAHHVFNPFDEFGLLLDLPRLPEERNAEYRQRLLDVLVHRGSADYSGLVNGITRELGLSLYDAISINTTGSPTNPVVEIDEAFIYLYSNWDPVSPILDLKIDRFDKTVWDPITATYIRASAFTLTDLLTEIGTSTYFTAALVDGTGGTRSMELLNQT